MSGCGPKLDAPNVQTIVNPKPETKTKASGSLRDIHLRCFKMRTTVHSLCPGLPTCAEKGVNNRWKHTTSAGSHHEARSLWCHCQCHQASVRSIDQVHHAPEWKAQHHSITVDTSCPWTASATKRLRALQICMSKRLTCMHLFYDLSHQTSTYVKVPEKVILWISATWAENSVQSLRSLREFLPAWDPMRSTPEK